MREVMVTYVIELVGTLIDNVVHHRLGHIINPSTFQPRRNLPNFLRNNSTTTLYLYILKKAKSSLLSKLSIQLKIYLPKLLQRLTTSLK